MFLQLSFSSPFFAQALTPDGCAGVMSSFETLFSTSSLPRTVQDVILEHSISSYPARLLPYSLLRGNAVVRLMQDLPLNTRHFELPEPDLSRNFGRAVDFLERCVVAVPFQSANSSLTSAFRPWTLFAGTQCSRNSEHQQADYYAAGGFVVSEILGFPPFGDVDLFFSPSLSSSTGECQGFSSHDFEGKKISAILTNNAITCIETFDLPICQAAIHCSVRNGIKRYQLLLSPACVKAYLMRACLTQGVHPCIAQAFRLQSRIDKYARRGLPCHSAHLLAIPPARVEDLFADLAINRVWERTGDVVPGWIVTLHGNQIDEIVLGGVLENSLAHIEKKERVVSSAVFVAPCSGGKFTDLVRHGKTCKNWFTKIVQSKTCLVAVPGFGRFYSNFIVPSYILDLLEQTEIDAVRMMRQGLPRADPSNPDQRILFGDFSLANLIVCPDWNTWDNAPTSPYWPSWMLVMSQQKECLRTRLFCTDSGALCAACEHKAGLPATSWRCSL